MRGLRTLSTVALFGLALFMLACGGSDGGGSNGDDFAPGGGGGSAANADLRMLGGDPLTLDPAIAGDAGSASYIVELFGGLVTLDKNLQIIPDIAERWEISPDGKV